MGKCVKKTVVLKKTTEPVFEEELRLQLPPLPANDPHARYTLQVCCRAALLLHAWRSQLPSPQQLQLKRHLKFGSNQSLGVGTLSFSPDEAQGQRREVRLAPAGTLTVSLRMA